MTGLSEAPPPRFKDARQAAARLIVSCYFVRDGRVCVSGAPLGRSRPRIFRTFVSSILIPFGIPRSSSRIYFVAFIFIY